MCVYTSGVDRRKKVSQCCSGLKGMSLTRSLEVSPTWKGKTDTEAIFGRWGNLFGVKLGGFGDSMREYIPNQLCAISCATNWSE